MYTIHPTPENISTLKYTIKVGKLSTQDPKQVEVRV